MPDGKSPRAFASLPPVSAYSPPNLEPARSRTDEGGLLHRNRSEFKKELLEVRPPCPTPPQDGLDALVAPDRAGRRPCLNGITILDSPRDTKQRSFEPFNNRAPLLLSHVVIGHIRLRFSLDAPRFCIKQRDHLVQLGRRASITNPLTRQRHQAGFSEYARQALARGIQPFEFPKTGA
jgi:hypothetical protein